MQIHIDRLQAPHLHRLPGGVLGQRNLIRHGELVLANHSPVKFHLPHRATILGGGVLDEVDNLIAAETHALCRFRQRHAHGLHTGVLDLVLQHAAILDRALPDGGVLQEHRLDPRIHPLDVERQRPVALQQAERQHAPVADAGLLGIELRHALAILHVHADALLGDDEQLAALLGRLADRHARHLPALGLLESGPGEVDLELCVALGLALEMQRHNRVVAILDVRPVAQRVAGDRLNFKPNRQGKAQLEYTGAGDPGGEIHQQHAPILSE